MLIITRYVTTEVIKTTVAVIFVLLWVGMSNEFVVQLSKAAAGELPAQLVIKLVLFNLPALMGILLPLGFFLGVVLTLSRLHADAEITVLTACGMAMSQLMRRIFCLGLLVTVIALYLHVICIPASLLAQEKLIANVQTQLYSAAVIPGRFVEIRDRVALFARTVNDDHSIIRGLFVAQLPSNTSDWQITVAKTGQLWRDPTTSADYLLLQAGHRYAGQPGASAFHIIDFSSFGLLLSNTHKTIDQSVKQTDTRTLFHMLTDDAMVELHWRFTVPLACLVVAFLAVPLSEIKPRQGRYASLLPSALVVMLYCNLLVMSRTWLHEGITPVWLGLWWVHLLALFVALLLFAWRLRWFVRLRNWLHAH